MSQKLSKLAGIIPPLVTPLSAPGELDADALDSLIEHVLGGGVHGIFLLGSTGEGPALDYSLRQEVISRACWQIKKRVPVLVGITDTIFGQSLAIARHAAEAGADALVLAPPYYLPSSQAELWGYLQRLTSQLPLPLVIYNFPGLTKVAFEIETVRRAMDLPKVIGIKDSGGDLSYIYQLCELAKNRADWSVTIGAENVLVEALGCGADGGVCGGANIFPRLYVALYDAAQAGDAATTNALNELVLYLGKALYTTPPAPSGAIRGIKCALSCLGLCDDLPAEPLERFDPAARAAIAKAVEQLNNLQSSGKHS